MLGLHLGGKGRSFLGTRGKLPSRAKKLLARFGEEKGNAIVEFAVVFPLLMTLVMGIVTFGQAYGTYQTLTNAASAGAQALAVARGQSTDPCITASGPVFTLGHYLNQANILFTITVAPQTGQAGTTYTFASNQANPTCASQAASLVTSQNYNATVKLTYPCHLSIYGVNFAPSCTLTAQTWEVVQ